MADLPLRTTVRRKGQPYVDEAVYAEPKRVSDIEREVRNIFKNKSEPETTRILVRYETVRLRWVSPMSNKRGGQPGGRN